MLFPGAPLTNFNDGGGVRQRFIFYTLPPPKITTLEFVYPRKSLLFLAYPKIALVLLSQPKKIPLFFSRPIDQENHFWPKFQTQRNHSSEWGPWGVIASKVFLFTTLSLTLSQSTDTADRFILAMKTPNPVLQI